MNRFVLQQTFDGVAEQLRNENKKLTEMYADAKTTLEVRNEQKQTVKDLEERFNGLKAQLEALDNEEQQKLQAQNKKIGENPEDRKINAKAQLIRAALAGKTVSNEVKNALGDGNGSGGNKILPSTMTNELLHEPFVKNPLRKSSIFTNITNLEVPRLSFKLDDDDFVKDTETAKELETSADTVQFGRHKFKVFAEISETILNGSDTDLVSTVEAGLESGLAAKEKKVAFASKPKTGEEHMSFYNTENAIKTVEGTTLYEAIIKALSDLEDMYSENAEIYMRKADYFKIITTLANGNTSLYAAQPEQILGAPVQFCDKAVDPVIGDFKFSHFNYDLNMIYDKDKNVKTGMEQFVLTAWIDHQIKLKSAFRIAKVKGANTPS